MSLKVVATFREAHTAHLAKAKLESEGIPAWVADEHLIRMQWLYSQALGGVKVRVPEEFAGRARQILETDHASDLSRIDEARLPPTQEELCPACGAETVAASRLARITKTLSLGIGIPFVARSSRLRCSTCGHRWRRQDHAA